MIKNSEQYLPPEPQVGNVEYKLKLTNPTKQRFEHLVTQLKWRLQEGNGKAIYEIGVKDNGNVEGIFKKDMEETIETLERMSRVLGAKIRVLKETELQNERRVAKVLIRQLYFPQPSFEIRIAVLGSADVGKSSLLGVLTQGILDNGRGKARLNMFRHLHEIRSGRTSSISHEILGFDADGRVVNYKNLVSTEEICKVSEQLVSLVDLAGHRKYFRTALQGLLGYSPHFVMFVISSATVKLNMVQEHLGILVALEIPFFFVLTKIDLVAPNKILLCLESILKQIECNKVTKVVNNLDDLKSRASFENDIIPIFCVSNVNGSGIELLLKYLYLLHSSTNTKITSLSEEAPAEFQIHANFHVSCVGQVLCGLLVEGTISEGTVMQIGPSENGTFQKVIVNSIHRNRLPSCSVTAGQSATIVLDRHIQGLRNGMVLLNEDIFAKSCLYFEASLSVLFSPTPICSGFQMIIHVANIRQPAVIISLSDDCVRSNSMKKQLSAVMKFKIHPEYLKVGQRLFFSDGNSRGFGKIIQVFLG